MTESSNGRPFVIPQFVPDEEPYDAIAHQSPALAPYEIPVFADPITDLDTDVDEFVPGYATDPEIQLATRAPLPATEPEDTVVPLPVPVISPELAQELAAVRDQAIQETEIGVVIGSATRLHSPVVWTNTAFTTLTGFQFAEVVDRSPQQLVGRDLDSATMTEFTWALNNTEPLNTIVRVYRRDGGSFWSRMSLSWVRNELGTAVYWVLFLIDVTEQIDRQSAVNLAAETERRARAGLALVSRVSDLLANMERAEVLDEVSAVLQRELTVWAKFYLLADELTASDELDIPLVDLMSADRTINPNPDAELPEPLLRDVVTLVLDGSILSSTTLELSRPYLPESRSAKLSAHIQRSLAAAGLEASWVTITAVTGQQGALGLLVTLSPAGTSQGSGKRELTAETKTILSLVARRVGNGLDNLALFAREHVLAETLQSAMLPQQSEVDHLDVWTYYAPSFSHSQVGGDWYDIAQLSPNNVSITIGDVVGHDVEAAAAMGQLRSVVRAYAFSGSNPDQVLAQVDQLVAGMNLRRAASLVLANMRRFADHWEIVWSRAGHLPLIRISGSEVSVLDGGTGPLIGFGTGKRQMSSVSLRAGDVIVGYTDGLIERRSRPLREGLDALLAACREVSADDAAGIGESLLQALADETEDDVAVVVVRIPSDHSGTGTGGPEQRRWTLPAETSSISRAREAVRRAAVSWNLSHIGDAELVVSELIANAIMHGWGSVALRLDLSDEGLRIEVDDSNPRPPVSLSGHGDRVGGYGIQIVERLADWGWQRTGSGKTVWALLGQCRVIVDAE